MMEDLLEHLHSSHISWAIKARIYWQNYLFYQKFYKLSDKQIAAKFKIRSDHLQEYIKLARAVHRDPSLQKLTRSEVLEKLKNETPNMVESSDRKAT